MSTLWERLRRRFEDPNGPGLLGYVAILVILAGIVFLAFVFFGPQTDRVLQTISPAV